MSHVQTEDFTHAGHGLQARGRNKRSACSPVHLQSGLLHRRTGWCSCSTQPAESVKNPRSACGLTAAYYTDRIISVLMIADARFPNVPKDILGTVQGGNLEEFCLVGQTCPSPRAWTAASGSGTCNAAAQEYCHKPSRRENLADACHSGVLPRYLCFLDKQPLSVSESAYMHRALSHRNQCC